MSVPSERASMVERQLAARGISDRRILEAFGSVPREAFVPEKLAELAYDDAPVPIGGGQTISQPYVVALTIDALQLREGDRVLEVGTGAGYAAAVLSRIVREVFTVERLEFLAEQARGRLARLGYDNVQVRHGDGSLGWPEHAPYDAIAVAAGGPDVPAALLAQLAPGGRLVMPVGPDEEGQVLVRVTVDEEGHSRREQLSEVRFVPLIGAQGWPEEDDPIVPPGRARRSDRAVNKLIAQTAEPIDDLDTVSLKELLGRVGDARVVLLGEATHGTHEFYRMRARITRELIERHGFQFVAVEADWPDAAAINAHVRDLPRRDRVEFRPFSRFPTWMWRNEEVDELVAWLRAHNLEQRDPERRAGFHGLDLYSLFTSIAFVLDFMERVDPDAARVARDRYGVLTPWQRDPAAYGQAVLTGRFRSAEQEVVATLRDLLARRLEYVARDAERYFDAAQNAIVVANAERYYRAMYYGLATSWNLRDSHMFDTLGRLLDQYGPESRGIVWAHNSHVGDASATEMKLRGELNLGELCRASFGESAYSIGFGTDHGTVAAASGWDEPMQVMRVRPALPGSYESLFHGTALSTFMLHLRHPRRRDLRDELFEPRLERAIGVVYRPETERESHYFDASLAAQFDEVIWFDETRALTPLAFERPAPAEAAPETYPFGL